MLIDHSQYDFQVEVPTKQVDQFPEMFLKLQQLSNNRIKSRVDSGVTQWSFEGLGEALRALVVIQETKKPEMISHRLICEDLKALFIQYGDF